MLIVKSNNNIIQVIKKSYYTSKAYEFSKGEDIIILSLGVLVNRLITKMNS
jgi:hypothetical protein